MSLRVTIMIDEDLDEKLRPLVDLRFDDDGAAGTQWNPALEDGLDLSLHLEGGEDRLFALVEM